MCVFQTLTADLNLPLIVRFKIGNNLKKCVSFEYIFLYIIDINIIKIKEIYFKQLNNYYKIELKKKTIKKANNTSKISFKFINKFVYRPLDKKYIISYI